MEQFSIVDVVGDDISIEAFLIWQERVSNLVTSKSVFHDA